MKHLKRNILTCSLILMTTNHTLANQVKEFRVFGKNISFKLPSNWKTVSKKIGVPLKLIGPIYRDRRPIITFVPIDLKDEKIKLESNQKAEKSYKISRLSWLQKFNGKAIKFNPLKVYKTKSSEVHKFSYSYIFNQTNFNEDSYYVYCNKNTYHIKSLVQLEHEKKWRTTISAIINSFQCK